MLYHHPSFKPEAVLLSLQLSITTHNHRNQVALPSIGRAITLQNCTAVTPCQLHSLPTHKKTGSNKCT